MRESNIIEQDEVGLQISQYFCILLKRVIVRMLQTNSNAGTFSLDVKCGRLGRNMSLIGDQYTAYYPAKCGKLPSNMRQTRHQYAADYIQRDSLRGHKGLF